MIYLASPFTGSEAAEANRSVAVRNFTQKMLHEGLPVFSPIVYTSAFDGFPGHFEAWQFLNDAAVRNSREVWVLCLYGWQTSKGVAHEIRLATELGLPVKFFDEEGNQLNAGD